MELNRMRWRKCRRRWRMRVAVTGIIVGGWEWDSEVAERASV